MKIALILSGNSPEGVIRAVNSPTLVQELINKVLVQGMGMETVGEHDFFVIPATMAIPRQHSQFNHREFGCEVRFNGRETAKIRNMANAHNTIAKMVAEIYSKTIANNLHVKDKFTVLVRFKTEFSRTKSGDVEQNNKVGLYRISVLGKLPTPNSTLPNRPPPTTKQQGIGQQPNQAQH